MFGGSMAGVVSSEELYLATVGRDSVVCENWWWLSFDWCYGMFGLVSETIVKLVVGVVIGCGLVLSHYWQNFTVVQTVPFLLQHWQRLAQHGPDRPGPKWDHAAISSTRSQLGNFLFVLGGSGRGWLDLWYAEQNMEEGECYKWLVQWHMH